jgi:hypothetical protein
MSHTATSHAMPCHAIPSHPIPSHPTSNYLIPSISHLAIPPSHRVSLQRCWSLLWATQAAPRPRTAPPHLTNRRKCSYHNPRPRTRAQPPAAPSAMQTITAAAAAAMRMATASSRCEGTSSRAPAHSTSQVIAQDLCNFLRRCSGAKH